MELTFNVTEPMQAPVSSAAPLSSFVPPSPTPLSSLRLPQPVWSDAAADPDASWRLDAGVRVLLNHRLHIRPQEVRLLLCAPGARAV